MRISKTPIRLQPIALVLSLAWASSAAATQAPDPRRDAGPPETAQPATRLFGVTALSDGRVGYHIDANGTLSPEPFYLRRPGRLVVDFPGVTVRGPRSLPAPIDPVRSLRMAQFIAGPPGVVRLVLEVDRSVLYRLTPDSTGATLVFGLEAPESASATDPASEPPSSSPSPVEPAASPSPSPSSTSTPTPTPTPTAWEEPAEGAGRPGPSRESP